MTCDVHLTRVLGLPAVLRGRSQGHVERAVLENDGHALRGLIVRRGFGGATDVLISADNLLVSELEVSLGLIDDFRDGRRRIRHFSASPDGDVLVPEGEILLEGRGTQ